MAKFTVIEGDGPRPPHDFDADLAKQHLRRAVIELLRALARGEDYSARFLRELNAFTGYASKTDAHAGNMIHDVITEMHSAVMKDDHSTRRGDVGMIVLESLKLAAEQSTDDGFTKARVSTQQTRIDRLIESYVVGHEKRSRESGWSWLGNLIKENFSARPVRKQTKAQVKRSQQALQATLDALIKKGRKKPGDIEL